jgi:hypothetical protein
LSSTQAPGGRVGERRQLARGGAEGRAVGGHARVHPVRAVGGELLGAVVPHHPRARHRHERPAARGRAARDEREVRVGERGERA